MDRALAQRPPGDVWVFGYGSLIWRPGFDPASRRMARVRGYHRSLCLWSRINRGSPDDPGLVFGLDRGGNCRGVVLQVPEDLLRPVFHDLWQREMLMDSYLPRWLTCATPDGDVKALAFVINRQASGYTGELQEQHLLDIVRRARGRYGPCMDYVMDTAQALRDCGIRDRRLEHIVRQLQQDPHAAL